MNNPASQYGRYQQQSALTASPGELTLMLYEGCVKFLRQSQMYMEGKNIEKASNASVRAQSIIAELMATLNMQYEVSDGLYKLYDFINRNVVQSNIAKDPAMLNVPIQMMTELRDTWQKAVRLSRQQSTAQGGIYTDD